MSARRHICRQKPQGYSVDIEHRASRFEAVIFGGKMELSLLKILPPKKADLNPMTDEIQLSEHCQSK
jgi:hypothetical protein